MYNPKFYIDFKGYLISHIFQKGKGVFVDGSVHVRASRFAMTPSQKLQITGFSRYFRVRHTLQLSQLQHASTVLDPFKGLHVTRGSNKPWNEMNLRQEPERTSMAPLVRCLPRDLVELIARFAWDLDAAAEIGLLEVVVVLVLGRDRSTKCSIRAMNAAARRGFLEIVWMLHRFRFEGCSTFAMNMAAANGHYEVVRFLHEHRAEGCTSYAMDAAAANGHLEVVRFLHQHRTEGCTTAAMDMAAAYGHLDVVKFLHQHRREGATVAAIDRAAQRGHLEVVCFLVQHRREGFTAMASVWAAENSFDAVVDFLAAVKRARALSQTPLTACLGSPLVASGCTRGTMLPT